MEELGLIDDQALPTKRGEIFSFFQEARLGRCGCLGGCRLPVEELVMTWPTCGRGTVFAPWPSPSPERFGLRQAFGFKDCPGYLKGGLPLEYGEGATEVLRDRRAFVAESEELKAGDVERVSVEWKSLLALIAAGPGLNDKRWLELQARAKSLIGKESKLEELPALPEMPGRQKERFERLSPGNYG